MEHKGIQYQVVQTANPTGFRWTVRLDETISSSYGNGPTTVLDHLRMEFWFLAHPKNTRLQQNGSITIRPSFETTSCQAPWPPGESPALLPPYTTGIVRIRSNLDIELGRAIGG
jgi:hypothetical protein